MRRFLFLVLILALWADPASAGAARFQFWSLSHFDRIDCAVASAPACRTVTTPFVSSAGPWDELVVSWNAAASRSAALEVFVRAQQASHLTRWYSLGYWTAPGSKSARASRKGQQDSDGEVKTDTLVLKNPAQRFQVRVAMKPSAALRFLGVSLTDRHAALEERRPDIPAWGRQLAVPGFSQLAYPKGDGWCSPASVAMILSYWANQEHRPDWSRSIPQCAEGIYDKARDGTGNWSFNAAFAGSLPGMRAYVTRLDDTRALEDWIAEGIPVILAVSVDLKSGEDLPGHSGHLVVCTGFTTDGDLIINDPWTPLKRGEQVRRVLPRGRLSALWAKSEHTVYIIHPVTIHPSQENTFS